MFAVQGTHFLFDLVVAILQRRFLSEERLDTIEHNAYPENANVIVRISRFVRLILDVMKKSQSTNDLGHFFLRLDVIKEETRISITLVMEDAVLVGSVSLEGENDKGPSNQSWGSLNY